jgi:DNA-binding HxlR family transcriptional regulator
MTRMNLTSRQLNHTGMQRQTMNRCASPVVNAITLVGGKWKIAILYNLQTEPVRFGELKRILSPITQQMLTKQLRELERDLLINRKVFEVLPPKVEYSLTEFGLSFMPVLDALCKWSAENKDLMQALSED